MAVLTGEFVNGHVSPPVEFNVERRIEPPVLYCTGVQCMGIQGAAMKYLASADGQRSRISLPGGARESVSEGGLQVVS